MGPGSWTVGYRRARHATCQRPRAARLTAMVLPDLVEQVDGDSFRDVITQYCERVGLGAPIEADLIGRILDLPGKSGEHQLRNQEVFYGKRKQTDAGVSAGSG